MNDRYSKLAFLHRVKERKTPSLSAQASFAPSSLKVAWSGKSLNHHEQKADGREPRGGEGDIHVVLKYVSRQLQLQVTPPLPMTSGGGGGRQLQT